MMCFGEYEQQRGSALQYTDPVAQQLAAMDRAHFQEAGASESLVGYGLVREVGPALIVTELLTSLERRLGLPEDFPGDVAGLLAVSQKYWLAVEPDIVDNEEYWLTLNGVGSEKLSIHLASFSAPDQISWQRPAFKTSWSLLLEHFFPEATEAKVFLPREQRIPGQHDYWTLAGSTWAKTCVSFEIALQELANSTSDENLQLFMTHYHPWQFLTEAGVDRLLKFSTSDLKLLLYSTMALMQIRVVLEEEQPVVYSNTLARSELERVTQPLTLLEQLVESNGKSDHFSADQLQQIALEYLQLLPETLPFGVKFCDVFAAQTGFYIDIMCQAPLNWQRKVLNTSLPLTGMLDLFKNPALYQPHLSTVLLHHLTNLSELPVAEQKQFDPSILLFLERIDVFRLVATILWSWRDVRYICDDIPAHLPKEADVALTPFMISCEQIRATLNPYLELLSQEDGEHLQKTAQDMGCDLSSVTKVLAATPATPSAKGQE